MRTAIARAVEVVFAAAATVGLKFLWPLVFGLASNAVFGWGDDQIAAGLGITAPSFIQVISIITAWGPPLALVLASVWLYHRWHSRRRPAALPRDGNAMATTGPGDAWLSDVLWRVAIGRWERPDLRGEATTPETLGRLERAETQVRQAARDGAIPIWHVNPKSGLYDPTPRSLWKRSKLDVQSTIGRAPQETRYVSLVGKPILVPHPKFMTSRKAVEGWLAKQS